MEDKYQEGIDSLQSLSQTCSMNAAQAIRRDFKKRWEHKVKNIDIAAEGLKHLSALKIEVSKTKKALADLYQCVESLSVTHNFTMNLESIEQAKSVLNADVLEEAMP